MTGLTIREYQDIPVRAAASSSEDESHLTPVEVDHLHDFARRMGERIFEHTSAKTVRFRGYVGLIRIGTRDIEILPKVDLPVGSQADATVRGNLLAMLLCARDIDIHVDSDTDSQLAKVTWVDALIQVFCKRLASQTRKGLVKEYRLEDDDLFTVRGRLLLDEQLQRNFIHKERIACEFDELDEDNPLNHLFKLALTRMLSIARSAATQRLVRETLLPFEVVRLRPPSDDWWTKIGLNRLTARFAESKRLAEFFLEGLSPDFRSGQSQSFSMLFNMNQLFEEYIGRQLRTVLRGRGLSVELQHMQHFLMHDGRNNVFRLKPDIVVGGEQGTVCIADTKWKRLAPRERKLGVSQADLYQMLGYARRYACERVLLIYPYDRNAALPTEGRLLDYQTQNISALVSQIQLADLRRVPSQLLDMFDRAVAGHAGRLVAKLRV